MFGEAIGNSSSYCNYYVIFKCSHEYQMLWERVQYSNPKINKWGYLHRYLYKAIWLVTVNCQIHLWRGWGGSFIYIGMTVVRPEGGIRSSDQFMSTENMQESAYYFINLLKGKKAMQKVILLFLYFLIMWPLDIFLFHWRLDKIPVKYIGLFSVYCVNMFMIHYLVSDWGKRYLDFGFSIFILWHIVVNEIW